MQRPSDGLDLRRVAVVGSSCAGKTTFARNLAGRLAAPHVELDVLHWGPGWTPCPPEEFRRRVDAATAGARWVADGNYSVVRDLVWRRATALVWLNLPFHVVFGRAWSRTLGRIATREEMFGGNRESLRGILGRDWIPWWVLRTYRRRRREYPKLFRRPEFAHLQVSELASGAAAEAFASEIDPALRFGIGAAEDLPAFIEILEEAASWLSRRGIQQWPPGSMRAQAQTFARWTAAGGLVLAHADRALAGGCFLVAERGAEWAGHPEPALHLRKLAVARSHAGRGVARRLAAWCEARARGLGADRVRLDCVDANARLRAYHRDAGYRELDCVVAGGTPVRLFERRLA